MSELNNPLFEDQREFLERQKEEYRNALKGDVNHIKTQGQEIGKKAALAGGVLLAGLLLKRLFSSRKKKVKHTKYQPAKAKAPHAAATAFNDYDSYVHDQEAEYTLSSENMPYTKAGKPVKVKNTNQSFLGSGVGKVLTTQVVTLLLVYAGKKMEEYLNSVSENNDIAEKPLVVTKTETTAYIIPEKDAL